MFLTYLILAVALNLSAVAAFYSIIGLTAIFSAATIPVIIMGSILEIAKLVITVWLHEYWDRIKLIMKIYLVPAVVVLMLITSMGIFGFLSRAHIEQTATGVESQAQVERIIKEVGRQNDLIARAETRFSQLQKSGTGADGNVQSQIDTEQQRIDSAYERIKPAVDEQNRIIDNQTKLYTAQIDRVDQQLKTLQSYIDAGEIAKAQSMIGSRADGQWGTATATALKNWQSARNQERLTIVQQLKDIDSNNTTIKSARQEIQRIRQSVDTQIAESNRLINRLREQLGKSNAGDVETALKEQQDIIKTANAEVDSLTQQQYKLEIEYRKLEAEVGPIKYIAEFIYGEETDKNMLEKAVRWVIIIIVVVFDPLAVMMLLAFTESRAWNRATGPGPVKTSAFTIPAVLRRRKDPVVKTVVQPTTIDEPQVDVAPVTPEDEIEDDSNEHDEHNDTIKEAKREWKIRHPDSTIKEQRQLLMLGMIDHLPWDEPVATKSSVVAFGSVWPDNPVKGYMFLRTDSVPTKLFKFNGQKWIEVNKELTDSYVANTAYIEYLMKKIESGEYDPELLNESELTEIETYLKNKGDK
jgi:cytochrome c oxidase subunit IV/regulator of replication initiation timing